MTQLQDALTGMDRATGGAVAATSRLSVRPLTKERIVIRLLLCVLALTTVYALAHLDAAGLRIDGQNSGGARLRLGRGARPHEPAAGVNPLLPRGRGEEEPQLAPGPEGRRPCRLRGAALRPGEPLQLRLAVGRERTRRGRRGP